MVYVRIYDDNNNDVANDSVDNDYNNEVVNRQCEKMFEDVKIVDGCFIVVVAVVVVKESL